MNLLKRCPRIFCALCLGWTCSNLNLMLPVAGAQKPAGDFQFSSTEPDRVLQEQGFAKMNWMQHECQRLERAGKQSLNYGEYDDALSYFDQSLRFRFNEGAAVGKAQCLLKLNRPKEALVLLKRANETTTSQEAWDLRIACLIELKRYDEALAICDESKQSWYPDYPSFLLRSKVYLAQDQKDKAIESLMDGYYHCTRYGVDKQPLRHALFELDIDPPDTVPHVKTGNEEILAIIQSLVKLDRPLNERGYASYFKRTLTPGGFGGHNMPAGEIDSTNRLAPLEQLSISFESGEITVRSNLDFTYLTREDLRAKFGALKNSEPHNSNKNEVVADAALRAASADSDGSELYLPCSNGWLKFDFRATDKCQLYFIHRYFSSISRPEPIADSDFLTLEKKVHQFILLKKYKEAFAELEPVAN